MISILIIQFYLYHFVNFFFFNYKSCRAVRITSLIKEQMMNEKDNLQFMEHNFKQ